MICLICLSASAQNESGLQLGFGYGAYRQDANMGTNISFSADYRLNKQYTIGQMSQFGFMHTTIETFTANYVNQHISVLGKRTIMDKKRFSMFASTGIGYTNYHIVQLKHTAPLDDSDVHGAYLNTYSMMQLSFPVVLDVSFKASKTIALGARMGGYITTQSGLFNYAFLNPVVKVNL